MVEKIVRRHPNANGKLETPRVGKGALQVVKSKIVLEVSRERKGAYVRAARPGTLAAWIFKHLDAASGLPKQCCERDHDHDGNCDRHPARRPN